MAWNRTEKQLCWEEEPGKVAVLSIALLCCKALPAMMSLGSCSNLVAKVRPSPHCFGVAILSLQPRHSLSVRPQTQTAKELA